jgi:hypothetical protein
MRMSEMKMKSKIKNRIMSEITIRMKMTNRSVVGRGDLARPE